MVIKYGKEYLQELYEKGKCGDKRHRYQPDVIRNYAKCIRYLSVADRIEDLFVFNSLNYEKLSGDKEGLSSVRINRQYRLEFSVTVTDTEPILTICTITDITNHYK